MVNGAGGHLNQSQSHQGITETVSPARLTPTKSVTVTESAGKTMCGPVEVGQVARQSVEGGTSPFTQTTENVEGQIKCVFDRNGVCKLHKVMGVYRMTTSTVWKDRGSGKGFGNVSVKSKKFLCSMKTRASKAPSFADWLNRDSSNRLASNKKKWGGEIDHFR